MDLRLTLALPMIIGACAKPAEQPATPAGPQEVTYTATDNAFAGPDSIAPGMTQLTFTNNGAALHQLILVRLDAGKTVDSLMAAMQANSNAEPDWIHVAGGGGVIAPGMTETSTQDLDAGHYIMLCYVTSPGDSLPHMAMGMVKQLTVAGARNTAAAPEADTEIHLSEFAFDMPAVTAGTHTFKVINDGQQIHEVALVKLNDGVTAEQFLAASAPGAQGPPPGVPMGGNGALSPGMHNWFTTTLEPGHYVLLCFVPDSADGVPHVMKGMVKEFEVPAAS
jgi:hypothetical protein